MQRRIRIEHPTRWHHHRSGWEPCIRRLNEELGTPRGVLCVHCEDHIRWPPRGNPIDEPFILISHYVPFGHPRHPGFSLTDFARDPAWLACREKCLGVITLSRYACEHARPLLGVPCDSILHATEPAPIMFSMERFLVASQRELVMVGTWLRRFASLVNIRAAGYTKRLLHQGADDHTVQRLFENEGCEESAIQYVSRSISSQGYDRLLSRCIVLLDLFDASANNAVLDCIARRTPILVRRLPAIVEYLGADYPFYFDTLDEAEMKLDDLDLIQQASLCLGRQSIQTRVDLNQFPERLASTRVYQRLAVCENERSGTI